MSETYRINEIFYSIQGEGIRAGQPSVFIRFAKCNLQCKVRTHGFDCDTEFETFTVKTLDEILADVRALTTKCRWLILTGGEPMLQVDQELILYFRDQNYMLAVETNGTKFFPRQWFNWVCVSPKVPDKYLAQRDADEVKYVIGPDGNLPQTTVQSTHYLLSPAFKGSEPDPAAIARCIQLCKEHPPWRISMQQHKIWNVR